MCITFCNQKHGNGNHHSPSTGEEESNNGEYEEK